MTRHQVGGTAANAMLRSRLGKRAQDFRMVLQAEVVVAAEVGQAGRNSEAPPAREAALLEVGERGLQRCRVALHAARAGECEQPGPCTCGSASAGMSGALVRPGGTSGAMPSRVISARSRATSGLPVVSSFSP